MDKKLEAFEYEFVELPIFTRELMKLCPTEEERQKVMYYVAQNRHRGVRLNKFGIRKLRVPLCGKGTRGGGRVIYYFSDPVQPSIFFLMVYTKSDKEDLTHSELEMLNKIVKQEFSGEA